MKNYLCMLGLLVCQLSMGIVSQNAELPPEHSREQCFDALNKVIATHADQGQDSLPEYCCEHNVAVFALLIKKQAVKEGNALKAIVAQRIEDHESLSWHAKNPNLSLGICMSSCLAAGGIMGFMAGVAATSLWAFGGY